MKKGKKLYEGKAKIVFATSDKNLVIQHLKMMQQPTIIKKKISLMVKEF